MKQILFFALRDDLLALIGEVESKAPLKYARMGNFARDEFNNGIATFLNGAELPNLGTASAESSAACEAFLVCERETPINLRILDGVNGGRICVDQLTNKDSVEFKPGGVWDDEVVLHGRIATVSDSQASQALMKRFQVAARKHFSKVKAFYVGPKALSLLQTGKRLTIAAQASHEFDLVPESSID